MAGHYFRTVRPSQVTQYAYAIQRNSRGSLPVYSEIRNGRTRYQVLVKNIKGDVEVLKQDIQTSLFENDPDCATRLKLDKKRNDTLIISGGRWKHNVIDWLQARGF